MSTDYTTMRTRIQLETLDGYTITRKEIYDHIVPLLGNNLTEHTCGFEPRNIKEWRSFLMGNTVMYHEMNADDYGNPTALSLIHI